VKEISELKFPDDFLYAKDHEWAKPEADKVRVGISDYARTSSEILFLSSCRRSESGTPRESSSAPSNPSSRI